MNTRDRRSQRSRRSVTAASALNDTAAWSRRRLLVLLLAATALALALLISLGYSLALAAGLIDDMPSGADTADRPRPTTSGVQRRDEIAAAPMTQPPPGATNPTEDHPATPPPVIEVPTGSLAGPGGVLTGFPHTPAGALGQLAAIETTVLQAMSLDVAASVYHSWALPAGAGTEAWPLTTGVRAFLDGAGMSTGQTGPFATVSVEPGGAILKGTDGPDWTLACVLLKVTASLQRELQVGYGLCERMQWVGGRWMIAPGAPPSLAPSAWPESAAAAEVGWHTWRSAPPATDLEAP